MRWKISLFLQNSYPSDSSKWPLPSAHYSPPSKPALLFFTTLIPTGQYFLVCLLMVHPYCLSSASSSAWYTDEEGQSLWGTLPSLSKRDSTCHQVTDGLLTCQWCCLLAEVKGGVPITTWSHLLTTKWSHISNCIRELQTSSISFKCYGDTLDHFGFIIVSLK